MFLVRSWSWSCLESFLVSFSSKVLWFLRQNLSRCLNISLKVITLFYNMNYTSISVCITARLLFICNFHHNTWEQRRTTFKQQEIGNIETLMKRENSRFVFSEDLNLVLSLYICKMISRSNAKKKEEEDYAAFV